VGFAFVTNDASKVNAVCNRSSVTQQAQETVKAELTANDDMLLVLAGHNRWSQLRRFPQDRPLPRMYTSCK
jgi:hypothetical protein